MQQIRFGIFETNSSSVHVLVIPKDTKVVIPKKVILQGDEFGWEFEEHYNTLDYVYQACVEAGPDQVEKFFEYLKRKGVEEIISPELKWSKWYDEYGNEYVYAKDHYGYIDHSDEVPLDTLFIKEDLLDRFCFGEGSYVQTGNDNEDDEDLRKLIFMERYNEKTGKYEPTKYYDLDKYDILQK